MSSVPNSIASLPTFTGAEFFLCDEMHLIGRNMSNLIKNLIFDNDKFKGSDNTKSYTFRLKSRIRKERLLQDVYNQMVSSREYIPEMFEGHWNGNQSRVRAVDLQDFLLYVIPTMVIQHLEEEEARDALMNLVNGCLIALQWSITTTELSKMKR